MLYQLIKEKNLDGILLSRRDSFSWLTCGGSNFVFKFTEQGFADILVTADENYLIASEVERYRISDEETKGLGFEVISMQWYENRLRVIEKLVRGKRIGSDTGVCDTTEMFNEIRKLRYSLLPYEADRLRELCRATANAVYECCHELRIGDTEHMIAARLNNKLLMQGVQVPVCLIAADDRIKKYRHPIPMGNKVQKYALVVVGAEKYGLFASVSRMVSLGKPSQEILDKHAACMKIDAAFIANTVVGAKAADILRLAVAKYLECGYPDEWRFHHQGGATGYHAREYIATFDSDEVVLENQAFSWNPTIAGTKCEDTCLITNDGSEILTYMDKWPMADIQTGNIVLKRPDILVR